MSPATPPTQQGDPSPDSSAVWILLVVASLVGIAATGTQIVEKIAVLKEPSTTLICDVNSTLSCSDVLAAWQSSVLGPPNALIGAIMFSIFLSAGATALLRSRHSFSALIALVGLATFFAAFASWFMFQTAFVIGALCLWCCFIVTAVLTIGCCLTRLLAGRQPDTPGTGGQRFVHAITAGRRDVIIWIGWWIVIAVMLWGGLAL